MLCPRFSRFPHGGYHRIYINAVVVSLSRWVAEEQVPVVLAVVRCGGLVMLDPSVVCSVTGRLIAFPEFVGNVL